MLDGLKSYVLFLFQDISESLGNQRPSFVSRSGKLQLPFDKSVTMDVDVDNDLQCPICLELYTYPIILPCSHVLCRKPCAEHLFDFNFIRCPVCRDNCYVSGGINSLPRVIALENIIERYKKESKKEPVTNESSRERPNHILDSALSIPSISRPIIPESPKQPDLSALIKCQHCKSAAPRRAKKLCLTCGINYCGACLRHTHPSREPYTSHEFTNPGPSTNRQSSFLPSPLPTSVLKAEVGSNHVTSYCQSCRQPFGSLSKEAEIHDGHPVSSVEEAHRELKVTASVESVYRVSQNVDLFSNCNNSSIKC